MSRWLLLVATLGAAGCPPRFPDRDPYIRGTVAGQEPGWGWLVDARPDLTAQGVAHAARAYVGVPRGARVLWRSGARARPADIGLGAEVSVWITGPVLDVNPPVTTAATVVIERPAAAAGRAAQLSSRRDR